MESRIVITHLDYQFHLTWATVASILDFLLNSTYDLVVIALSN